MDNVRRAYLNQYELKINYFILEREKNISNIETKSQR
jgi:hypothetical protein